MRLILPTEAVDKFVVIPLKIVVSHCLNKHRVRLINFEPHS